MATMANIEATPKTERLTIIRDRGRNRYVATLEIRQPDNPRGLSPGFSITGEIYEPHGTWSGQAQHRNGRESDSGGAIGEELARIFPELAPFARVHLAGLDGAPWSAAANAGWYYPGAYSGPYKPWLTCAREACADRRRRFATGMGELLREDETEDGRPHYATAWSERWPSLPDVSADLAQAPEARYTWAEIAHRRAASQLRLSPEDLPRGLDRQGFANLLAELAELWRWEALEARQAFYTLAAGEEARRVREEG